jgi:Tol biopolymer transport system component
VTWRTVRVDANSQIVRMSHRALLRIGIGVLLFVAAYPSRLIASDAITITSPNGREQYAPGDSITISWSGVSPLDPVRLSYSTDGGASWSTITESATGLTHRWSAPSVATGDALIRAELWEPRAIASIDPFPRHIGVIAGGGLSPDGTRLATLVRRPGHPDNADVYVWDVATHAEIRHVALRARDVNVIEWSPDGSALLLAGTINSTTDTSARIIDAASGAVRQVFRGHRDRVVSGAFSPDGSLIATGSFDFTVRIWSVATGELVESIDSFRASVGAIAFSSDGTRMATAGGVGEGVQIFDAATWQPLVSIRGDSLGRSYGAIKQLSFSPDDRSLLGATEAYGGVLWSVATARTLRSFIQRRGELLRASFSPSGRYVVGGRDSVWIWNAATGERLLQTPGAVYPLGLLDFSPDGSRFVAAGRDSVPRIYTLTGPAIAEDRSDRTFGIGMPARAESARASTSTTVRVDEDAIIVTLEARTAEPVTLALVDLLGRTIARTRHELAAGAHRLVLPTEGLAPGRYVLVVSDAHGSYGVSVIRR